MQIEEHYGYFTGQALRVSEGNTRDADYFIDCSIYEFYYRLRSRNKWVEWHNEQVKKQTGKGANVSD